MIGLQRIHNSECQIQNVYLLNVHLQVSWFTCKRQNNDCLQEIVHVHAHIFLFTATHLQNLEYT